MNFHAVRLFSITKTDFHIYVSNIFLKSGYGRNDFFVYPNQAHPQQSHHPHHIEQSQDEYDQQQVTDQKKINFAYLHFLRKQPLVFYFFLKSLY